MDSLCMPYILLSVHDRELDDLAEQIQQDFPNCGYCMMQGHLLRQGHRIPHAGTLFIELIPTNCGYCVMQGHCLVTSRPWDPICPLQELSANLINLWLPSICQRDRGEGTV